MQDLHLGTEPQGEASENFCLLHISVKGYFKKSIDSYCAVHNLDAKTLTVGLFSDLKELGSWGRGRPLCLTNKNHTNDEAVLNEFVGQVVVAKSALTSYCLDVCEMNRASTAVPFTVRLVLLSLEGALEAVDGAYSYPYPVRLSCVLEGPATTGSAKTAVNDVIKFELSTVALHSVELLQKCSEVWTAELDLDRLVPEGVVAPFFRAACSHYPFQRNLVALSPSELKNQFIMGTGDKTAQETASDKGALLSLTFYAHDPSMAFSYEKWFDSLRSSSRDVVTKLTALGGKKATAEFMVSQVAPVTADGMCWCESHLPTSAPVKKKMDERREARKRDAEVRSHRAKLSPASPVPSELKGGEGSAGNKASQVGPALSTTSFLSVDEPDTLKGWAIRPLKMYDPVECDELPPGRSQVCWNCLLNCASLENHALEVTIQSYVTSKETGNLTTLQGTTIIIPQMLKDCTAGVLQLPVHCAAAKSGPSAGAPSVWVVVFVQYAVIFPFAHDYSDLRVIRSVESYASLTIPSLVGHRGLGKTYTRGRARGQMSKLAENSIEALNAAHRRGCDMVEFDVMLTLDRVPVIIHDPIVLLQARERGERAALPYKEEERQDFGKNRYQFSSKRLASAPSSPTLSPLVDRRGSSEVPSPLPPSHSFAFPRAGSVVGLDSLGSPGVLTGLQKVYFEENNVGFTSIAIAVHQLTKRQLDAIVTESCDFSVDRSQPRLKTVVLRHWSQILRVYRNRTRLQCIRDHSLTVIPEMRDEFRGCDVDRTGITYLNPTLGLATSLADYQKTLIKESRFLQRQIDITNYIPALRDLFELTPPSLRLNIEVKYPFMPQWDANLFLQKDFFEINGFVDAVLDIVFNYAEEGREIAFSSFDPDICIALATKQGRYDVLFLSDTEEKTDLKDYRSFFIEGAIQFATVHNLSGISINATTLCREAQHQTLLSLPVSVAAPLIGPVKGDRFLKISDLAPLFASENHIDLSYGKGIVSAAHARKLKVWTWGDANSVLYYAFAQFTELGVDGVITDNIPNWFKGTS